MVAFEHIERGLASYIDANIMNNFPENGWKKVVIGAAIGIGMKKYMDILKGSEALRTIGIIGPDGAEIDMYAEHLKKEIPASGITINLPMLGELIMHESDVDEVLKYIHNAERGY